MVINSQEPAVSSGLREYEKVALERSAKRRAHEQTLRAMLKKSVINSRKTLDLNLNIN